MASRKSAVKRVVRSEGEPRMNKAREEGRRKKEEGPG
jgi:hypothetical protein